MMNNASIDLSDMWSSKFRDEAAIQDVKEKLTA